jgi:secondary thiamine-phosphate synthase enzyme
LERLSRRSRIKQANLPFALFLRRQRPRLQPTLGFLRLVLRPIGIYGYRHGWRILRQRRQTKADCHGHYSYEAKSPFHTSSVLSLYYRSTGGRTGSRLPSQHMTFHTEHLTFRTASHREYINITPQVEAALRKSGIREGMILVSAMHITAAVYVNDAEEGLIADIDEWLEHLAPFRRDYRHHQTGETNGDSHLKSLLMHHEVIVPVTAGKLDFGPWQQVYYAEFDGRRPKRVIIKVMGE